MKTAVSGAWMEAISIGDRRYRIHAAATEGDWTGFVERADTGDRVGPDWSGSSRAEVVDGLSRWLDWQHEHVTALAALQAAERAYHRAVAGGAFADSGDSTSLALRRSSLAELEAATEQLNRIRALGARFNRTGQA